MSFDVNVHSDTRKSFTTNFPRVWIIADRGTFSDQHILTTLADLAPIIATHPGTVGVIERDHTGSTDAARLRRILALKALLGPLGVPVWVNRRVDLALAARADGVQLTGASLVPASLAQYFQDLAFAASCHDAAGITAATAAGVRFVLLSPFFDPTSKAPTRPALGVTGWRALTDGQKTPIVALGGIEPTTAALAMSAGATAVATLGGVLGAPNPPEALSQLLAATGSSPADPRSAT